MQAPMTITESAAMRRGRGGRHRSTRPERITLGDIEYVRNDVIARELDVSERTVNRDDKKGAPYRFFAGCKYRPIEQYAAFIASGIQTRKPTSSRRKSAR
jgi:hypothetical protein